jgi:hypothetical protein
MSHKTPSALSGVLQRMPLLCDIVSRRHPQERTRIHKRDADKSIREGDVEKKGVTTIDSLEILYLRSCTKAAATAAFPLPLG